MARDYKREYELEKQRGKTKRDNWKTIGTKVSNELYEEYYAKCSLENTTVGIVTRSLIQAYCNNEIAIDKESGKIITKE